MRIEFFYNEVSMSSGLVSFPSRRDISKHLKNCFKEEKLVDDYLSDEPISANRITDKKIISAVARTFAHSQRAPGDIRLEIRLLIDSLDSNLTLSAEKILEAGSRITIALGEYIARAN